MSQYWSRLWRLAALQVSLPTDLQLIVSSVWEEMAYSEGRAVSRP